MSAQHSRETNEPHAPNVREGQPDTPWATTFRRISYFFFAVGLITNFVGPKPFRSFGKDAWYVVGIGAMLLGALMMFVAISLPALEKVRFGLGSLICFPIVVAMVLALITQPRDPATLTLGIVGLLFLFNVMLARCKKADDSSTDSDKRQ